MLPPRSIKFHFQRTAVMHHFREVADSNPELNRLPCGELCHVSSSDNKMHRQNDNLMNL